MNYTHTYLFAEDRAEDDEIDTLFSRLQLIAPPATLVEDILASVARLAAPTQSSMQRMWQDIALVVHVEDKEPS
ncbi:MAG: hypothetical protein NVS4B12_13580 [Ktedonobacteraceae bacterium]